MTNDDVIRVIIVDDHAVVRSGLKAMLSGARDMAVVGEAANGEDGVALAMRLSPDVVLMDIAMAPMGGLDATRELVARGSTAEVLVLTVHAEDEYLVAALDAGAAGYLVKSAVERELLDAIRALAHDDMYVQPRAARLLAERAARTARGAPAALDRDRLERLSDREQEVLRLIAAGHSAASVGHQLAISAKTVDTYKQRINEKLGMSGRPEYVQFALRVGLLTPQTASV